MRPALLYVTAAWALPALCSQTPKQGHLTSGHARLNPALFIGLAKAPEGGVGVAFVSPGVLLALGPSGNFLGQGINDPTFYVFEDRVRVLVPIEGDGLSVELLQFSRILVEQIHFELDLLFSILWVLKEAGLDFHGRRWLVHEVVPTREKGKQWTVV